MEKDAPLIVTLKIDHTSQNYFDLLRDQYFPKHVNYLKAHLTLFHKFPALKSILQDIILFSNRQSFDMPVSGIKNIGNGNAFVIASPELQKLHRSMQAYFSTYLTAQDRNKLWPHITIQNKVTAYKALVTHTLLDPKFVPFTIRAQGLSVWKYLNGPWEHMSDHLFT